MALFALLSPRSACTLAGLVGAAVTGLFKAFDHLCNALCSISTTQGVTGTSALALSNQLHVKRGCNVKNSLQTLASAGFLFFSHVLSQAPYLVFLFFLNTTGSG